MAAILLAATVLRLWGITYGLPHLYYPDEGSVILRALGMGSGDLNPHFFEYPALTMYALAFAYGVAFLGAYAVGWVHSLHDFALAFVTDPTYFYLCARGIVAALGVGTVWLTCVIGRRLFDWRIGLAAAALLAVNPLHTRFSHFMKVEGPEGFFVLVGLLAALRIMERDSLRQYIVAGVWVGVCASIKYPGVLVFLTIAAAHLARNWGKGRPWRTLADQRLWMSALVTVAVFLAANPFIVLDFRRFWFDLSYQAQVSRVVWVGMGEHSIWDWLPASISFQGCTMTVAWLIAVPYFVIKRKPAHQAVLAFVIPSFLLLGSQKIHQAHWLIPLLGCMMVFGVAFVREVAGAVIRPAAAATWAWAVVMLFSVLEVAPRCVADDHALTLKDTRTLAKDWIERNIPAGSTVLMDRGRFIAGYNAPILPDKATIERLYLSGDSKQGGVAEVSEPHAAAYFQLMIEAVRDRVTYKLIPIVHDVHAGKTAKRHRPPVGTLDSYLSQGVEYIVTSSGYSASYRIKDQTPENMEFSRPFVEFYDAVDRRCRLLREFAPEPGKAEGPVIRIYDTALRTRN